MVDPRQCSRCGFGPVDHRGCSDLRHHHLEVSVSGGSRSAVSNACPRCQWFTGCLDDWPSWTGELQTERGRALFRQRVWGEVILMIRSSSKALLFPISLLLLGNCLRLPPSISAFLAFSYLIPWVVENRRLAVSLNSHNTYSREAARRRNADFFTGSESDDCGGRQSRTVSLLPPITQSEALNNILSSMPARIFMVEGDFCSVCLQPFSAEAVQATVTMDEVDMACKALQTLEPPVVVLCCGHPLHVGCAEAAVRASEARHVRCPLCREPVTVSGGAMAIMFS